MIVWGGDFVKMIGRGNWWEEVEKSSWENHLFRLQCAKHYEKPLKAKIVSAKAYTKFEYYIQFTIS